MRLLRLLTLTLVLTVGWLGVYWATPSAYSDATTFTVNSNADTDDGVCNAAHCTLREAINAANSNPGTDTIAFAIVAQGVPSINVGITGLGQLPVINDPLIISGTTQSAGRVELNGTNAGVDAHGLRIEAGNSVVRGLIINRFNGSGILLTSAGNNAIEASYIGADITGAVDLGNKAGGILIDNSPDNRIGGASVSQRNLISGNGDTENPAPGIAIEGPFADRTLILGNHIGTNLAGTADLGNEGDGIRIDGGSDTVIGGAATGAGNLIAGNNASGIHLVTINTTKTRIEGNLIGTNASGLGALPNAFYGIHVAESKEVTIGGTVANTRNVIAGNGNHGLLIVGNQVTIQGNYIGVDQTGGTALANNGQGIAVVDSVGITIGGTSSAARNVISANTNHGIGIDRSNGVAVQGNYIGVNSGGAGALGNGGSGINILQSSSSTIGGPVAGAGNVIANNTHYGVVVRESGTTNMIRANSIYANGNLGIDLSGDGVTPNDPLDPDAGINNFVNFPVLFSAQPGGGAVIQGILNSRPNASFNIDFYSSPSCDASSFGEGQTYLGFVAVATNPQGTVSFTANLASGVTIGHAITATTTDINNNTSEFSRCLNMGQTLTLTTVTGKVDMQARTDDSLVRVEAGGQFVFTQADGAFNMTLPSGEYTIKASHSLYLSAQRSLTVGTTPVALPTVTLLGGDTNDDGTINLPDLLLVAVNYSLAAPPADERADISDNGVIDLPDLLMVAANYTRTSPQPWPTVVVE